MLYTSMEDAQTMLQLQLSGKLNGQDTRVTVSIDTEEAFDIQDMDVGQSTVQTSEAEEEAVANADGGVTAEAGHSESPDTSEEPTDSEPSEAVERVGEDDEDEAFTITPEDMPPMTYGTKQFKVGEMVLDNDEGDWMPSRDILEAVKEAYPDDNWSRSIVTSHIDALRKKSILTREKDDELGVFKYTLTPVGEATLTHVQRHAEE